MNLKSIATVGLAIAMSHGVANAEKAWQMVIDGVGNIPLTSIEYVVSHQAEQTMDVVLNDNATVFHNIPSVSFVFDEAGVGVVSTDQETVIGPFGDTISVTGLKSGSTIMVYNMQGVMLESKTSQGENSITIDISGYAPGIYVLRTANSTVKFQKR